MERRRWKSNTNYGWSVMAVLFLVPAATGSSKLLKNAAV